jgi:hypothetical protein
MSRTVRATLPTYYPPASTTTTVGEKFPAKIFLIFSGVNVQNAGEVPKEKRESKPFNANSPVFVMNKKE